MKIAISLPNELSERIDALAAKKKVSRSALYVAALEDYLKQREHTSIKEALDAVYGNTESRLDEEAAALQSRTIQNLDKW